MPSSCGMLVYNDDTSMEASKMLLGSGVFSIKFMKSLESFMCDGSCFTYGCSHLSTNCEIFSVMLLQLDTIGLVLIGFLCIFFKKYSLDVRGFSGGLQKLNHVSLISLLVFSALSLHSISCLSVGVMSVARGL